MRLRLLLPLLLLVSNARAVTCTNVLTDGFGNPLTGVRVIVTPFLKSTVFGGTNVLGPSVAFNNGANGSWSQNLVGGFYYVQQGISQPPIVIWATPGDTNSYSLATLASAATNPLPSFFYPGGSGVVTNILGSSPPIDVVRDFGAVGDGVTPCQSNFQAAINYALSNNISDIYVPSGNFLVCTNGKYVALADGTNFYFTDYCLNIPTNTQKLRFIGESGSTLIMTNSAPGTNSHSQLDYYNTAMFFASQGDTLEFRNLHFKAIHEGYPPSTIEALMQGYDGGSVLTNVLVDNCFFRDFGTALFVNRATNLKVHDNTYRYTMGRDECGGGFGEAATGINTLYVENVDARNDDWLGSDITNYTGITFSNAPVPMDNYFFGVPKRGTFIGNRIQRNGVEGMIFWNRYWGPTNTFSTAYLGSLVIANNIIDGDPQPGQGGYPGGYNGIRMMGNGAYIANNQIYNQEIGIMAMWDYPKSWNLQSLSIVDNDIRMFAASNYINSSPLPIDGILLAGYTNVNVSGNRIYFPDRLDPTNVSGTTYISGVYLGSTYKVNLENNWITCDVPPTSNPSYPTNHYILSGIQASGGGYGLFTTKNNYFVNLDSGFSIDPSYAISPTDLNLDDQTYQGCLHAYTRINGTTNFNYTVSSPMYDTTEHVTWYAPTSGWYRVIISEDNTLAGRLEIGASDTNTISSDSKMWNLAFTGGGAGGITKIIGGEGTPNPAIIGAIRESTVDHVAYVQQADVYFYTNCTVDMWWKSYHPLTEHLAGVPLQVTNYTGLDELSETNIWNNSPSITRKYAAYTLNGIPIELVPGDPNFVGSWAPFSGGTWINAWTNTVDGHQVLMARTSGGLPWVLWDSNLGGNVQSNKVADAVRNALSLTNGPYLDTNGYTLWPATAAYGGQALLENSNGYVYMLMSKPGSSAWTKTNLIASP